ncbi:MAG TPA: hypothetical protein VGB17_13445 [Pyrinomonadaceae bacterium]|jgi:hypothetical protein
MSTIREILNFYDAAEAAFENGQYASSAELYERASQLSELHDDEDIANRYSVIMRRDMVHSFLGLEKLREALTALAPLTEERKQGRMRSCCIYGTMGDQVYIGLDLPVTLPTLEKVISEAESYYRSSGEASWRSKVMHMRARVYETRGMFQEARLAAQEGWSLWRNGCPAHYATTHLKTLFDISLARRDAAEAHKYLRLWDKHNEKNSRVRDATYQIMQSRLARLERETRKALDQARRAVQTIAIADWNETRYAANCALVRALLLAGEHERAKETLVPLMRLRRSESAHDRYSVQLLRGDYHLARARIAAGLVQSDDEFDMEFPLAERDGERAASCFELKKARDSYQAALKVGRWIDEQLRCAHRQREIHERLARLKALEKRLEAKG